MLIHAFWDGKLAKDVNLLFQWILGTYWTFMCQKCLSSHFLPDISNCMSKRRNLLQNQWNFHWVVRLQNVSNLSSERAKFLFVVSQDVYLFLWQFILKDINISSLQEALMNMQKIQTGLVICLAINRATDIGNFHSHSSLQGPDVSSCGLIQHQSSALLADTERWTLRRW